MRANVGWGISKVTMWMAISSTVPQPTATHTADLFCLNSTWVAWTLIDDTHTYIMCPRATCGRSWRILYGSEHGLYMFQHVSSQQCTFAIRIEPVWECILRIGIVGGNVDKNPSNPKFKIVCRAYNHFKLKPCCRPKQSCMSCVKTLSFRAHEPSLPGTIPTTMFALFELITAPDLAPYRVPRPGDQWRTWKECKMFSRTLHH